MTRMFRAGAKDEATHLLDDLDRLRIEYRGRTMPGGVVAGFEKKLARVERLTSAMRNTNAVERWSAMKDSYLDEIPEEQRGRIPASPSARKGSGGEVAGFLPLSEALLLSAGFQAFLDEGMPRHDVRVFTTGTKALVDVGGKAYVALSREERRIVEQKAVPTIGSGVIEPQRLPVSAQVTGDQRLRLRDVIPSGRATSNAVAYIREESFTSGADYQLAGSPKGEATANWSAQTANVVTVAHWMPALNQMLADWGPLSTLIDSRLRYGVLLKEEAEMVFGVGGDNALEGILAITGTHDVNTLDSRITSPTIIDSLKVAQTEVRKSGYEPDTVLIAAEDWEAVLLTKGSDLHYLHQSFPAADGSPRLFGMRVVESQALVADDNSRVAIVLDSRRACALHIREDLSVTIGLTNDDFIRNRRTILAEERVAFTIYAPAAIAVFETAAAV